MTMEIKIECVRCGKEMELCTPLLFKYPVLTVSVFRCKCKDAEQGVDGGAADLCRCKEPCVLEKPYCTVCGKDMYSPPT